MNYITNYYKNKSEVLQEKVIFLQNKLQQLAEEVSVSDISGGKMASANDTGSSTEQTGLQQELARLFANWANTPNAGEVLGQILARYSGSSNVSARRTGGQPIGPSNIPEPKPIEAPKMKDKNNTTQEQSLADRLREAQRKANERPM